MDDKRTSLFVAAVGTAVGVASAPLVFWPLSETTSLLPSGPVVPLSATGSFPSQDPLIELMMRTDGSLSEDALNRGLRAMFAPVTQERLDQLPALLQGLRGLGLRRDQLDDVEATLIEILANADPPLDDRQIEMLAAAFVAEPEQASLAKPEAPDPDSVTERGIGSGVGPYQP